MGIDVEVHDLCDGKIFVTCATSSPFNLIIPGIGGLVCDGGSLLAHPSITASKYTACQHHTGPRWNLSQK